jgi:hypothetical protein
MRFYKNHSAIVREAKEMDEEKDNKTNKAY